MANRTARRLRKTMTEAEECLWRRLRHRRIDGFKFRRQVPMGRYVVDFVCLEARLVVEVDGGQHAAQEQRDAIRSRWLKSRGYRVLRFWNNEVLQETEAVEESIRRALAPGPPRSTPT